MVLSVLWVPSYSNPDKGAFSRSRAFVEASIGDARFLNPILNADTASSRIVGLLFDGLLKYDRDLELVADLAQSFTVYEYLYVNLPEEMDASAVAARLNRELKQDRASALGDYVSAINAETGVQERRRFVINEVKADDALSLPAEVEVDYVYPQRIAIKLDRVVTNAESLLAELIGASWLAAPASSRIRVQRAQLLPSNTPVSDEAKPPTTVTEVPVDSIAEAVAEQVPALEHNPVIDFTLRRDVRFHDGHELDAEDVVFTYESIMEPRNLSPRTSDFEPVKSVVALSSHEVRVTYKRLFAPAISAWTMPLLPEHLLNEEQLIAERKRQGVSDADEATFGMKQMPFNRNPIGTGAYRFERWSSDEIVELAANQDYWRAAPMFDQYSFRIIPDTFSQELELQSGALDVFKPEPHQVERFLRTPRFATVTNDALLYSYIGYNTRKPPFDDPLVRRALGHAIDVDEIIKYVLHDQGSRTSGPFPPTTRWYNPNAPVLAYDPEKALALLNQAGWEKNQYGWLEKDGKVFQFNLITNQGNLVRRAVMTIAQDAWRKIGIQCNTQVFEWAVFLKDFINPGKFDATVLGWSLSPDPDQFSLWHSSQTQHSQLNFTGYASAEVDALLEKIRITYDEAEQQRYVWQLHERIAQDQPYTFLYTPLDTRVINKAIALKLPGQSVMPIRPNNSGNFYHEFLYWTKTDPVMTM